MYLSVFLILTAIRGAVIFQDNPNHKTLSYYYHGISENITKG